MRIEYDNKAVIQVNVRGVDHDFQYDPSDLSVTSNVLAMIEDLEAYRAKGARNDKGKTTEEQIRNLRDYVDEGISLCRRMNAIMEEVLEGWSDVFPLAPMNLNFWADMLTAIMRQVTSTKVIDKVNEQMRNER